MTCIDIVGWDAVGVPGPTGAHSKRHKILEKKGTESASNHALEVANIAMRRRTAPRASCHRKSLLAVAVLSRFLGS